MERAVGIEPTICTLARYRVTTLLCPHDLNYTLEEETGFEPAEASFARPANFPSWCLEPLGHSSVNR